MRHLVSKVGNNIESTTGQGITIDATYTVPTTIDLVDGNYIYVVADGILNEIAITSTMDNFELNPTNLSGNKVYQNFIFSPIIFTTVQKDALRDSPETFLYIKDGINKSDTLNQAEIDAIIEWMPTVESGAVAYGMIGSTENTVDIASRVSGISSGLQTILWKIDTDGKPTDIYVIFGTGLVIDKIQIGARPVVATPLENATMFAAPDAVDGVGDGTIENPYSLSDAISGTSPAIGDGDILFLRGGDYLVPLTGMLVYTIATEGNETIIESYPNETANITMGMTSIQDVLDNDGSGQNYGFTLQLAEYVNLRRLHFTGFWEHALQFKGTRYCKLQGCSVYNNFGAGVIVNNRDGYTVPYVDGWNEVSDSSVYNNSDAGLEDTSGAHNNGDNADGISISSGQSNHVHHCSSHHNSDDAFDSWRSNDTIFEYCVTHNNGIANGNGNGFKLGGVVEGQDGFGDVGLRAISRYNISYNNKQYGFDQNGGQETTITNCTSYNNGTYGYGVTAGDVYTILDYSDNIAQDNALGPDITMEGDRVNNSWQIGDGVVDFYSTDDTSDFFLVPTDPIYQDIGVYADMTISDGGEELSYSMGARADQSSQIVMPVPTEPYSIVSHAFKAQEVIPPTLENEYKVSFNGGAGQDEEFYITAGPPTTGDTVAIKDINQVDNGVTLGSDPLGGGSAGGDTGGANSGFLRDSQLPNCYYIVQDVVVEFFILGLNDSKTYTIRISGSKDSTDTLVNAFVLNGETKTHNTCTAAGANTDDGVEYFNVVPVGGAISFTLEAIGDYAYISGLDILEHGTPATVVADTYETYVYTDDKQGDRHLYIDNVEQPIPSELTGNITIDYVSILTGEDIEHRELFEVYSGILEIV